MGRGERGREREGKRDHVIVIEAAREREGARDGNRARDIGFSKNYRQQRGGATLTFCETHAKREKKEKRRKTER